MALGFTETSGADFLPIIKFDARAGRFFRVDRTQGTDGWSSNSVDITQGFQAVFDFANIEAGWAAFVDGRPSFAMAPVGGPFPAKPSENHKQGFRITVMLGKKVADGEPPVREMASTAMGVRRAIDALHDEYVAGLGANPGMLPVVACDTTTAIESQTPAGKTINYAPVFTIKKWVKRPADLDAAPESTPSPAQPPATGSTAAAPPPKAAVGTLSVSGERGMLSPLASPPASRTPDK